MAIAEVNRVLASQNESGAPVFCLLVKRTYQIVDGGVLTRAEASRPLREVDEYWDGGDPTWSTVKYEHELAPYKLATDVVVIGKVLAPREQAVFAMDVAVKVGAFQKGIRVFGDRRCVYREGQPPVFTDPSPFTEMEVRYEKAYGGKDEKSLPGLEFNYPRNPMGTGVAVKNTKEAVDGMSLPNFEDPRDLLTPDRVVLGEPERWNQQPLPQGFGWLQKTWYPRCSFVGAIPGFVDVDEVMREEQLGWVPRRQIALARQFKLPAFHPRFNNGAPWGLILPFLDGTEPITLHGLSQAGEQSFRLPGEKPRMMLDIGLGEKQLDAYLHTVSIRLEDQEVDLIWRGAHRYPGVDWLPEMKRLHAEVA